MDNSCQNASTVSLNSYSLWNCLDDKYILSSHRLLNLHSCFCQEEKYVIFAIAKLSRVYEKGSQYMHIIVRLSFQFCQLNAHLCLALDKPEPSPSQRLSACRSRKKRRSRQYGEKKGKTNAKPYNAIVTEKAIFHRRKPRKENPKP